MKRNIRWKEGERRQEMKEIGKEKKKKRGEGGKAIDRERS